MNIQYLFFQTLADECYDGFISVSVLYFDDYDSFTLNMELSMFSVNDDSNKKKTCND